MIPPVLLAELLANGGETAKGREVDFHPIVKIFDPAGSATWLLTEVDPSDPSRAFGLCDLGMGCPELGYVDLVELATVRNRFGLRLEIDRYFRPTKRLSAYAADARRKGRIVA
ncbi:DUF2958 domain-containing protein [Mesorhizobium sp. B2-2-2]|uniref:DUF2958 domain-containing protein n=1 Tax=Mesorhizobium sp. B2-2-2 TaxID=2589964 RepID=UPI00112B30FD|nr:DUF2958 domain-containing protein [Mesorhizobium sp. B2-2-2]TPM33539.1 DUF2958 domain-containing protein [Mesorhizobium sp. B2-2-2]